MPDPISEFFRLSYSNLVRTVRSVGNTVGVKHMGAWPNILSGADTIPGHQAPAIPVLNVAVSMYCYAGSVTTLKFGMPRPGQPPFPRPCFSGKEWVAGLGQGAGQQWGPLGRPWLAGWASLPEPSCGVAPQASWPHRTFQQGKTALHHRHPGGRTRHHGPLTTSRHQLGLLESKHGVLKAAPGAPSIFARARSAGSHPSQRMVEGSGTGRCSCSTCVTVPLSQMQTGSVLDKG